MVVPGSLITESAAAYLMATKHVDCVVVCSYIIAYDATHTLVLALHTMLLIERMMLVLRVRMDNARGLRRGMRLVPARSTDCAMSGTRSELTA
eukprot:3604577-Rhodomonas_salina.4